MGICAAGGHFIGSYLRGLHEFVAGGQGRDAVFLSERVGAVHDVLFHGVYIGIIGRGCGFWLRFRFIGFCLCWRFTGVGLSAFYLHTTVDRIPVYIETDLLAHVPQLHIVVSSNVVGFHFHLLTIHKDGLPGRFRRDPGCDRDRAAGQRRADHHAGEHHTDILSHIFALVHLSASILTVYV